MPILNYVCCKAASTPQELTFQAKYFGHLPLAATWKLFHYWQYLNSYSEEYADQLEDLETELMQAAGIDRAEMEKKISEQKKHIEDIQSLR